MPPNRETEKRLWEAADELRANSRLRPSEYSFPVRGLIFLRQADHNFQKAFDAIKAERASMAAGPRPLPSSTRDDYIARGAVYLPAQARYRHLLNLPEGDNLGRAVNDAMRAIEAENDNLIDVLPKTYNRLESPILASLLRTFHAIDVDEEGDTFGQIYEYFLSKFAMSEGQRGGEFYTPTTLVQLIVEILEPFHGRILDPAAGSGGMFVQSARFVKRHRQRPSEEISIYGQELIMQTVRLCKMNLAVHGLEGLVRQGNSYYEDVHRSVGRFDFVMANPPFNVNKIDFDRIKNNRARFPFGMPTSDNGNFIWIQLFYSALNETGRAGFVMANSASDARGSELEIRRQLIQTGAVDAMVAIASNFFYTVTLPCTLWFLDRGKAKLPASPGSNGQGAHRRGSDTTLFLDARHIYTQVDRAHREFSPEQLEFLANVVRLYRGEEPETERGSAALMAQHFPDGVYRDVPGLCKVATMDEIEAQGWSLNPGRYVGVEEREAVEFDFAERFRELHEELQTLNTEAHELEALINDHAERLLEGKF